ncbi:MAG: hypothetical protein PWR27_714 [Petroclostridium sp.]|jgi:hypothetical protein|uniref:YwmB family TATA-box binding protein n=1 Tax=Petroclostridium xylanilyticum TaxID=1792311 RepID=UPI000B982A20|nr:YwmB family TATA-box binding protein [Petroclostridium xylanilyticum]MBZ4645059.1 hypothetical protein [Clostridia bacterium]MDK2810005.1 hypothetical protein [Petroclostridium sp.]
MKKLLAVTVLTLIVISFLWYSPATFGKIAYDQAVMNAFNNSQADILTASILCKGVLGNYKPDITQLEEIVKEISNAFEFDISSGDQGHNSSDTYLEYWFSGKTLNNDRLKIEAWSEQQEKSNQFKSYIAIELSQDGLRNDFELMKNEIQRIIMPYVSTLQITSNITGTYKGNLDEKQIENISTKILNDSNAKKVRYTRKDNIVSVSAFSPLYGELSLLKDKKANLELSIRYSAYDDKTYISLNSQKTIK